jgi:two-component system cell cycle response regulator DivK
MLYPTERLSWKAEHMAKNNNKASALILVAEDDEDNRFVMRTLLEMRGYRVVEATNGQEAVQVAARDQPDLILMDLKMPVLNGLAAMRHIRQHEARRVPIIALSAYDPLQHRAVAIAAGCDDYVLKPIDYDGLEGLIKSMLAGARPRLVEQQPTGELTV